MAEVQGQKTLTLAEQYSLPQKQELADQIKAPVEVVQKEVAQESDVTTVTEEKTDVAPAVEEKADETPVSADKADDTPPAEESSESPEPEESDDQEDAEQKPEIKLETAPADFRFPTTNQSRHCFTRYIEYHRCIAAKGDDAPECDKFAKYYRSLCPGEWVDRWNEQRENGTFPGPL